MPLRLPLNQTLTHWPTTSNGFGGFSFGTPVQRPCRWEDRSELIPDSVELSKAVLFVDADIAVEDYVILGASTSLTPDASGALRVRAFKKIPDLRNLESIRKVWL